MTWNLTLALIPLGLALVLFRPGARRGWLWWLGVIAFAGFLPNAPYILTDAIHLASDLRRVHSPSALLFAVLPLYSAFFLAGLACNAASLSRLNYYLRAEGKARWAMPVDGALHVLVAVGIFLGRFDRVNSWDVLARPIRLASAVVRLGQYRALTIVFVLAAVIAAAKIAAVYIVETLWGSH